MLRPLADKIGIGSYTIFSWIIRILVFIRFDRALRFSRRFVTYSSMGFLSAINHRRRISSERIWYESQVLPIYISEKNSPFIIVGFRSYNYHYLLEMLSHGQVLVIEPNHRMVTGARVEREYCRLEDWQPAQNRYGLIDFLGVYGYGLNEMGSLQVAIENMVNSLRQHGVVLFGINADHDPLCLMNPANRPGLFKNLTEIKALEHGVLLVCVLLKK